MCASLNHRKRTKAAPSRMIPRKSTENLNVATVVIFELKQFWELQHFFRFNLSLSGTERNCYNQKLGTSPWWRYETVARRWGLVERRLYAELKACRYRRNGAVIHVNVTLSALFWGSSRQAFFPDVTPCWFRIKNVFDFWTKIGINLYPSIFIHLALGWRPRRSLTGAKLGNNIQLRKIQKSSERKLK